jgi:hypothetical protein
LVFDLELWNADAAGTPTTLVAGFGAAPIACQTGNPGDATAKGCVPTGFGFYSSINDGDSDGLYVDNFANAALATSITNVDPPPAQLRSLQDAASLTPPGPFFDYGWYPTANGRGGIDLGFTKLPLNTAVTGLDGKLVGFGAGYTSFDGTNYRAGVGKNEIYVGGELGFGADKPLFEGQICTNDLPGGTYVLKVVPSAAGTNVLHSKVNYLNADPDYGGFGTFAAAADTVTVANATGVLFQVDIPSHPTAIAARKLFYNQSYYDTSGAAIQVGPGANNRDDDVDATDTIKTPLVVDGTVNACTPENISGYAKGINGLWYDVTDALRAPLASDFTFTSLGKNPGAVDPAGTAVSPLASQVVNTGGANYRVFFTFANATTTNPVSGPTTNTWLKVTIGTGFGLAAADVHYWGHAAGDTGSNTSPNVVVNPADVTWIKTHPSSPLARSLVSANEDVTKDSTSTPADVTFAKGNPTSALNCLKFISR